MVTTYKLFRFIDGELYPLYVLADKVVEVGKKLLAEEGKKNAKGKVIARKLNPLSYRPGWHSSNKPYFKHITSAYNSDGTLAKGFAICECTVEGNDCTEKAQQRGKGYNACFKSLDDPDFDGYYEFRTNVNAKKDQVWIISDNLTINRIIEVGK